MPEQERKRWFDRVLDSLDLFELFDLLARGSGKLLHAIDEALGAIFSGLF